MALPASDAVDAEGGTRWQAKTREVTSKLMFELYSVPSLAYAVSAILSYHNDIPSPSSSPHTTSGLEISFNTLSTSVIPIVKGKGIMSHAKRGSCTLSFPFVLAAADERTEEGIARVAEKRHEQGKMLQEMAVKRRIEKIVGAEFAQSEGFNDDAALDQAIKKLEADMKKKKTRKSPSSRWLTHQMTSSTNRVWKRRKNKSSSKPDLRLAHGSGERAAEMRKEDDERAADPFAWAARVRAEHSFVMERIKEHNRRRAALGDRKSAASVTDEEYCKSEQNDVKEGCSLSGGIDDMFGADDEDLAIYRKINTAAGTSSECGHEGTVTPGYYPFILGLCVHCLDLLLFLTRPKHAVDAIGGFLGTAIALRSGPWSRICLDRRMVMCCS
ncbi:hypothetical protein BJV77DRAFT_962574 [Russula vinacea]|nr:hypothetical protein BJV77DRAFT_962574 [Russula vinacea]